MTANVYGHSHLPDLMLTFFHFFFLYINVNQHFEMGKYRHSKQTNSFPKKKKKLILSTYIYNIIFLHDL